MRGLVALISVASIAAAGAQQEIPRFKSGVEVVQFTVTVLDKDRHPVTGLTASDFDVLVDGQPKPLAAFSAVTLPDDASRGASSIPSVAPDVHTNRLPAEGRVVVIVIDRSTPDGQPMLTAHAVANAAIDRLGPNDLGAVVYTGAVTRKFSQGLTADRERLHAAANLTHLGAVHDLPVMPSLSAAIASRGAQQTIEQVDSVPLASEEQGGDCPCGLCVIKSLTALAETLSGAMGREKSILFVGSSIATASKVAAVGNTRAVGAPAPPAAMSDYCAAYIYPARDKLTRALDAANVTVHAIDPVGLLTGEDPFRQMSLAVLPDYTGGRLVINTNSPAEAIGPLFDESRSYYVLAIGRDAAASKDNDPHKVKISVKRSGAIVHARSLYFAEDPKAAAVRAPTAAAGALNELLPGGDFSLQMNLVPQFAQDGSPDVRVLLGVDSAVAGKLDVLIRTYDRVFTPVGTPVKQRLDVPAAAVAGSKSFQWSAVLKPPPGDYEVRAAVATADGKHAANVIGYVDVPDIAKQGLALSGIVVKSGGTVTLQRAFGAGAAIGLSFQVARATNLNSAAAIRYLLRDDLGQAVANIEVPHEAARTVTPGIDAYDIGVRLPAVPGRYVATLEASDDRQAVQRHVLFTVR